MADLPALTDAIERGDRTAATDLTQDALDAGLDPGSILGAMTLAMEHVGEAYECADIYVPEMLIAARAMKESMAVLEPVLVEAGIEPVFTAVVGTVRGDLHDIGKNLVATMWRGANIAVVDLGTNVAPETFVDAVHEHGARLVGVSALLTTTMLGMRDVVEAVRSAGLDGVKVMVGGAPVTAEFAERVGADGFAPDAASAVEVARRLVAVG
jgi:5-methyltetrahydrofolate--homocysteine methyltransferase